LNWRESREVDLNFSNVLNLLSKYNDEEYDMVYDVAQDDTIPFTLTDADWYAYNVIEFEPSITRLGVLGLPITDTDLVTDDEYPKKFVWVRVNESVSINKNEDGTLMNDILEPNDVKYFWSGA